VGGGIISDKLAGDFGRKAVWDFFDSIYPISDISPRLSICDGSVNREAIIVTRAKSPPLTSSNSDVDLLT